MEKILFLDILASVVEIGKQVIQYDFSSTTNGIGVIMFLGSIYTPLPEK